MGKRIAILGGGPMGLAVAYQLACDGHQPTIFEAADRVGGMCVAFDFSGTAIERFYHFHCTSDIAFFSILKELALYDKLYWTETKMGYWYRGILQPWGNPLALIKFKGLSLFAKIRYGLHAYLSTKRNDWMPLDHVEATGWIKRFVGKEAYEVLWRRLFDLKFYAYAKSISAAWMQRRIRRVGRSRYSLFREKLGYLEGGSETLLRAMQEEIELRGGFVQLNSPVSKVVIENGVVQGVEVAGSIQNFDNVISTIPLPYIPQLMPDLPAPVLAKFQSIKNIGVVCVIVKLRKPLSKYFWLNSNDPEMDIPGMIEYTNLRPMLGQHIVYAPFYMPSDHQKYADSDEIFLEKVRRYMMKINPEIGHADFIDQRVSRYRFAQPVCEPNFLQKLPPVALPIKGLWVADTSYYYPEDRGISESIDFGRKLAKLAASD